LPSLRERKEDIPLLIDYFLKKFNKEYVKNISIGKETIKTLINYSWPGNVRELENTIERLVILSEGNEITLNDLPFYIRQEETFKACNYNQTKAAKMLSLTKR